MSVEEATVIVDEYDEWADAITDPEVEERFSNEYIHVGGGREFFLDDGANRMVLCWECMEASIRRCEQKPLTAINAEAGRSS